MIQLRGLKVVATILTVTIIGSGALFAKTTKQKGKSVKKKTEVVTPKVATAADTILAEFTGGKITKADLNDRISKIPAMYQDRFKTKDGQIQVLDNMILEEIFYRDAVAKGYDKDTTVVRISNNNCESVYISRYYEKNISNLVKVNNKEMQDYYTNNKDKYKVSPMISIQYLRAKNDSVAQIVNAELKKGTSFVDLIRSYSEESISKPKDGIITGIRNNGIIMGLGKDTVLDSIICNTPVDSATVVGPYTTTTGIHYFKKLNHVPQSYKPFDTVKNDIETKIRNMKEMDLKNKVLADLRVRYNAKIDTTMISNFNARDLPPDERLDKVITASDPSLTFTKADLRDLIQRKNQQERMNIVGKDAIMNALNFELDQRLLTKEVTVQKYAELYKNDPEVIQTKRMVTLRIAFQKEIVDNMKISDDEVKDYYEQNKESFAYYANRKIQVIAVKDEKVANKIYKKAKKIIRKGDASEFTKLVKDFSLHQESDGYVENVYKNGIVPTYGQDSLFCNAIWSAEMNKETPLIQTKKNGEWVIFRLVEDHPIRYRDIAEVDGTIRTNIRVKRSRSDFDVLTKQLFTDYKLTKYAERLITVVSAKDLFEMAETAQKGMKFKDAIFYYDQIIQSYPNGEDDYKAWFMKAFVTAEDLKEKESAIKLFEAFLQKWPNKDLTDSASFMLKSLNGDAEPELPADK